MLILKDSLLILTKYLTVAQRRIEQSEALLNPQTVQDAQQLSELLKIKIHQLQRLS